MDTAGCLIMGKRKSRPVTCKGCGFLHDLNLDGWVILLSGELICASNQKCWETVCDLHRRIKEKKRADIGEPGAVARARDQAVQSVSPEVEPNRWRTY